MKPEQRSPIRCDFCGACVAVCPADAIQLDEAHWRLLAERCTGCEFCATVCPMNALEMKHEETV